MENILKKYFGFSEFRPLQKDIIESILDGKDTFVLMPTGGGKSLCYQLPALKLEGLTLVISPLISLMKDQVDSLKANGIPAEFINSSLSFNEIKKTQKEILNGKVKILYVTPERLSSERFKSFLKKVKVSMIAVDEAHCISEWGHDFRPAYRNLKTLKTAFPEIPIAAFTATATKRVRRDILNQLNLSNPELFISSLDRENLKFQVIRKNNARGKLLTILEKYRDESVIIYCFSRKSTKKLSADLRANGYRTKAYHAGLDSNKRSKVQELFIKDEINIIVATIAFGMGIDKLDVRLVVHYTFPKSIEGYYQEIGRAGRDGLPSECIMFYTYADIRKHRYFIDEINDEKLKKQGERKLREMMDYAEAASCRRKYLLEYFGENYEKKNCQGCDYCLTDRELFEATTIAQKVISAIIKLDERFGLNYTSDVLMGSQKKKILNRNHDQISVYGIVDEFSKDQLKQIIRSLIGAGLIERTRGEYPVLTVTAKGEKFLKNKEKIELPKPKERKKGKKWGEKKTIDYDVDLFEKLRTLRKKIADEMEVPAFIVFSDASLQEMSYYLPADLISFGKISGVGEKKLKSFGEDFLAVINKYREENNLKSKKFPIAHSKAKNKRGETYRITQEFLEKKIPISEIANERGLAEGTIISHINKIMSWDNNLDLEYLEPSSETFNEIKKAFEVCETEMLRPVYRHLQEKYDYDTIRLVKILLK